MLLNLAMAGAVAAPLFVLAILRWRWVFIGLLLFIPISGAVTLWLKPSNIGPLLKDILFILPLYGSIFLFHTRELKQAATPRPILYFLLLLILIVLLQSANPGVANFLVAAIGVKVWLLYIPLMFIAAAYIDSYERLLRLFRLMMIIAIIPAGVGLLQWFMSELVGYQRAISWFYGDAAFGATQGFTSFTYGGRFYRIPSTFAFVSQYSNFLLAMIPVAYVVARCGGSYRERYFGWLVFFLFIVASFLSGSRGAFLLIPCMIFIILIMDGRVTGFISFIALVPIVLIGTLYLAGLDPSAVLGKTQELTSNYSEDIVFGTVVESLRDFPFGTGTGMSTSPARYAFDDSEVNVLHGAESYYAKSIIELGIPGLFIVVFFFLAVLMKIFQIRVTLRDRNLQTVASALFCYVVLIVVSSGKGSALDIDPANIYFWIFLGIVWKLPWVDYYRQAALAAHYAQPPLDYREDYRGPAPIANRADAAP